MKTRLLATLAILALAACGEREEETAATQEPGQTMSQEEIGAAMENVVRPRPGQYRTRTELVDLTLPNIPGGNMEQLRTMMERNVERETLRCITPEEANRGYEDILRDTQDSNCSVERFSAKGGNIDARMVCNGQQGSGVMTMTGTATETSSDMSMSMTNTVPEMGEMAMRMRMVSERVGDCPA